MKNASNNWNQNLKTEASILLDEISNYSPDHFSAAIDAQALLRAQKFQTGVKAYHNHPYVRDLSKPETIWSEGGSRLLDYQGPDNGPVLLCVPSLINKAYILDLSEKRSFMRSLSKKGIRSFLLDWGDVADLEKKMDLSDYILGRLSHAVAEIHKKTGRKVALLGYCMGGVLTTAFAALSPEKISSLILLATPWDFHAGSHKHVHMVSAARTHLENVIRVNGVLPIDVIQALFSILNPFRIHEKFSQFSEMKQTSKKAEKFVALEDWLNDGVDLGGTLAKECLLKWYIENQPQKGTWTLKNQCIDPQKIQCPTLFFIPEKDQIVPPQSAHALANLITHAQIRTLPTGHIGMITGRKAVSTLYTPIAKWLLSQEK